MNADLTQLPTTDPADLYRPRDSIYAADLLIVGLVHLNLFSVLNAQPRGKTDLCRELKLVDRPADVMLTLFTAMGLLEIRNGLFEPTLAAREHLVQGSPWFLGPYYASLKDRPAVRDFLKVLKTGKPANWGSAQNLQTWIKAMEDEVFANQFTSAMDCRGLYLGRKLAMAMDWSASVKVLDVAGGSGIYACSLAAAHPHLHAAILERPPVDVIARRLVAERGFAQRVSVVAGDMFTDPWPDGHDTHLLSNVLHDWDEPEVIKLMARSYQALPRGGRLVIHDAHIDAAKSGPLAVAEYSAFLMHASEGKCYSIGEMEALLEQAGFGKIQQIPTAAHRSVITATKE